MSKTTLLLFIGFLLVINNNLSNVESRRQPSDDSDSDDDRGTIIGPHTMANSDDEVRPDESIFEEELGTVVGPHTNQEDEDNVDISEEMGEIIGAHTNLDDELGTVIGPDIDIRRRDFPEDFIFGTSVSAYQVEGAKKGSGRGLTTWDEFTHMFSDKVENGEDGDVGVDFIARYKDDIQLMKDLNTNGFRFSVSWTRIMPYGNISKGINKEGVQFYNDLIDELVANDIEPSITLFHWESPLALETEYGGFLNERIVADFREFAKFCFNEFGDRVKNWATFNEPSVYSVAGYSKGKKAPGRCSPWETLKCPHGDSSMEPYTVAHNQILAHLAASEEFKKCEQCQEGGGKLGIVLVSHWFEPQNPESSDDIESARRSLEFQLGWFLSPLTYGHYPPDMLKDISLRLPEFTEEESEKLKDSLDFVGLNYYGAFFSTHAPNRNASQLSYITDLRANWTADQTHSPHLKSTAMGIVIYPLGLMKVLKHIKDQYMDPEIYIMENGMDELDDGLKTVEEAINDYGRQEFIKSHILIMAKSIKFDQVRLKGYFVWSLMDNFEWEKGYRMRFGLYYVDFNDDMKRHMRASGKWFSKFLAPNSEESLSKCYFEGHRAKGYAPKLFDKEFLDPDNARIRYTSDFM